MPKAKPDADTTAPAETVAMVDVDYKGAVFAVPKDADDWNTEDIEVLRRRDNVFDVVRACIGPDQYTRFQQQFPKWRDFKEFRDLLFSTINDEVVGL